MDWRPYFLVAALGLCCCTEVDSAFGTMLALSLSLLLALSQKMTNNQYRRASAGRRLATLSGCCLLVRSSELSFGGHDAVACCRRHRPGTAATRHRSPRSFAHEKNVMANVWPVRASSLKSRVIRCLVLWTAQPALVRPCVIHNRLNSSSLLEAGAHL